MPELNEPLSERELDILRLVATGAANKEIAQQLVISPNTVKVHLRNIFAKIGVVSRTEATLYAIKVGLVKPHDSSEAFADEPANGLDTFASPDLRMPGLEIDPPLEPPKTHNRLPTWQIGLLIATALLLIIASSVIAARLLARPNAAPTVASEATAQITVIPRWAARAPMPSPRKGMGIIAYENAIYVVGGETNQGIDGQLLRYDPEKNTWSTLASKQIPVTDIQAALVGEKIYVPGGRLANGEATNLLEVYDPRKGTWESKAPLPQPLSAYGMVSFEGQIYLFGGKNGAQYSTSVYVYDPQEDRWSSRTKLQSPRAYPAVVESGGKIYVFGGYDGQHALNLNEAYLPNRDINGEAPWKTLTPLPEGRYSMGAAQIAGLVFLLGGLDENNQPAAKPALQYTAQTDEWGEYEIPPVHVGNELSLLATGNYLYVLGGETPEGLSAANLTYQAVYTITVPILINDKP